MQKRKLGKNDVEVSIIGCGGVVAMNEAQDDVNQLIAYAFDKGVRYFDVAPQYGDAQERFGPALEPYRDYVTLACKTLERSAEAAAAQLEDSLQKLRTDHFDIYQMHALSTMEDVEQAFGPGGAIETFLDAKEKGKTRLIGASVHDEEAALAAIDTGLLDTVLVPLNFICLNSNHFGAEILDAANEHEMGILAIKSSARTRVIPGQPKKHKKCWYEPVDDPELVQLMLRYTLSLPGVCALLPPGQPELFKMAVDMADQLEPIDERGIEQLHKHFPDVEPLFPKVA